MPAAPLDPSRDAPTAGVPYGRARGGPQIGDVVYGYTLEGELGRGGHGVVFRARDSLNRLVALKILPRVGDELRERLLREAQAMHGLDYHGIVKIQAAFVEGEPPCLVLDFVDGRSLEEVFADPAVTLDQKLDYLEQVARAVHYAHQRQIVHRDLKPANVLVAQGAAKVTDFGLARDLTRETRITKTGDSVGTPQYMAPEQVLGKPIGPPTDIHALGVMLYEALTGSLPYPGATVTELQQHIASTIPPPPSRSTPLAGADHDYVCRRALAKDPDQRYPDALTLARDLERLRLGEPLRGTSPKWRLAALCLLPLTTVLVALLLQRQAQTPPPQVSSEGSEKTSASTPSTGSDPGSAETTKSLLITEVPPLPTRRLTLGAWVTVAYKNTWRAAVVVGDSGDAGYDLVFLNGAPARHQGKSLLPDVFVPGAECEAWRENRPLRQGKILERRRQAVLVELEGERVWVPLQWVWIGPEHRVPAPEETRPAPRGRVIFSPERGGTSTYPAVELEQRGNRSLVLYVDSGWVEWQVRDRLSALPAVGSQVVFQPYEKKSKKKKKTKTKKKRVLAVVLGHLEGVIKLRLESGEQVWAAHRQVRVR